MKSLTKFDHMHFFVLYVVKVIRFYAMQFIFVFSLMFVVILYQKAQGEPAAAWIVFAVVAFILFVGLPILAALVWIYAAFASSVLKSEFKKVKSREDLMRFYDNILALYPRRR